MQIPTKNGQFSLLTFLSIIFLSSSILNSQNVVFTSQADLNNFTPTTSVILGDLIIGLDNMPSDIFDLSNLTNIKIIHGNLIIQQNPLLVSLNGLSNLENIDKDLLILDNENLINLEGLDNLLAIGDRFAIRENDNLFDLKGIENLDKVNRVDIRLNPQLNNLDAINNINGTGGVLKELLIVSNDNLVRISTEDNPLKIISCEYSYIHSNGKLANLHGLNLLENTKQIGTDYELKISDNEGLVSVDGLENLDSVGFFWLEDNINLTDIQGISNLKASGIFRIENSPKLQTLLPLKNMNSCSFLNLKNLGIENLNGLENILELEAFTIKDNQDLLTLDGTENLNSSVYFVIDNNTKLIDLKALSNLKKCEELNIVKNGIKNLIGINNLVFDDSKEYQIWIGQNPNLISLDGFPSNSAMKNLKLLLFYNPQLENLNALTDVVELKYFWAFGSPFIESLNALKNLKRIESFKIQETGIKEIGILNQIDSMSNITISGNTNLQALNAFENLEYLFDSESSIMDNPLLNNCCSLKNPYLEYGIDENLSILDNLVGCNNFQEIEEDDCTSFTQENVILNEIYLFPNPTNSAFYLNGDIELKSINLVNASGMLIHSFSPKPQSSYDISNLKKGVYFLIIQDIKQNRFFKKLIKQ